MLFCVFFSLQEDANEIGSIIGHATVELPGLEMSFDPFVPRDVDYMGGDLPLERFQCFHNYNPKSRNQVFSQLTGQDVDSLVSSFVSTRQDIGRGKDNFLAFLDTIEGNDHAEEDQNATNTTRRGRRSSRVPNTVAAEMASDSQEDVVASNGDESASGSSNGQRHSTSSKSELITEEVIRSLGRNSQLAVKRLADVRDSEYLCTLMIRRFKHLKLWPNHMKNMRIFHPSRWDAVMENLEEDKAPVKEIANVIAALVEQTGIYDSEAKEKTTQGGRKGSGRYSRGNGKQAASDAGSRGEDESMYEEEGDLDLGPAPPRHAYGHLAMEKSHPEGGSSTVELNYIRVGEKYQSDIPDLALPDDFVREEGKEKDSQIEDRLWPPSPHTLSLSSAKEDILAADFMEPPKGGIPWTEEIASAWLGHIREKNGQGSGADSGNFSSALFDNMTATNFYEMRYDVVFSNDQELEFMKAFNLFGKEYNRIARRVPNASTNDCVAWYYKNKPRIVKGREHQASIAPVSVSVYTEMEMGSPQYSGFACGNGEEAYRSSLPSNHGDAPPVGTLSRNLPSSTALICQNKECQAVINQKQFNVQRNLYRMRRATPTWEDAMKCPFWLCAKCCPPPADSRKFHARLKYGFSEESEGSRLRRKAAVLADAQRLAREMEHGNRSFAKYAEAAFHNLENRYKNEDNTDDAAAYSKYLTHGGYTKKQSRLSIKDSVDYVSRVQAVYGKDSAIFCRFLKLMHRFRKGVITPVVLARKMTKLFHDNVPLLKAFCLFLPSTLRQPYLQAIEAEVTRKLERSQACKNKGSMQVEGDETQTMESSQNVATAASQNVSTNDDEKNE